MESNILSTERKPVVFHLQSNSVMHLLQRDGLLAGMLPHSIYGRAPQHRHILCWNRKQPNCRSLQISMWTDGSKYIQDRAALLHPEGTRFFPSAILYVESSTAGAEQRGSPTHSHTCQPIEERRVSECYSYLSPVLRNACEPFKSSSITLLTSPSLSSSSGTQ